jgi:hypothetical protein
MCWWILHQGCAQDLAQVCQIVYASLVLTDQEIGIFLEMSLHQRTLGEGGTQRDHVPWRDDPVANTTQQALEVSDWVKELANRVQSCRLSDPCGYGVQPSLNCIGIEQRPFEPLSQEPPTHRGDCFVQHSKQGGTVFVRPAGRDYFQAAF